MISRIFDKLSQMKLNRTIFFILLATLIAETAVIIMLDQFGGVSTQSTFFAMMRSITILPDFLAWSYKMVGPVIFPLMILAFVQVWASFILWQTWRNQYQDKNITIAYDILGIVEEVSPGFGFLGTCISLMFTMHCMDPKLSQTDMLKTLLDNSSSAFGSTVCGISMAITAFLTIKIFKKFLLKE